MVDVHLDDVSRAFGDVTALDGVSLDVVDGEFFTLVGPSGCGKTTTLRTIAGFEPPTAGSVRFGEREMRGVEPEDRDVGIVFQNYALFPHVSVAENVAYGLKFHDPPDGVTKRERVEELLSLVDLEGFGDRDPNQLSGGQQQRVALARALAPEPDLLLLDEPMSALDARLRERLRRQVKRIQSELNITTVYVTHDQEEALAVSDRLAVMNEGRIEQVGTPQDVYRRPASEFVASFVGDNNLFEGTLVDADADSGGAGNASNETSTVSVDGATFRIPAVDWPAGSLVTFCVRPESLRLVESTGDDEETDGGKATVDRPALGEPVNRFAATVEGTEFLGGSVRVELDWRGKQIALRTAREPAGDRVVLGFDPEDVSVL